MKPSWEMKTKKRKSSSQWLDKNQNKITEVARSKQNEWVFGGGLKQTKGKNTSIKGNF